MTEIRVLNLGEIPDDAGVPVGAVAVGAVEDGKVVALLGAFTVVFLDPLWVAPDRRKDLLKRGVLNQIWSRMKTLLLDANVRMVVGHANRSQPAIAALLRRIGGIEVFAKRPFMVKLED